MKKFVKWTQEQKVELNMTRTQILFTEQVLQDKELCDKLSQPGDLQTMLRKIQMYLKNM